MNDNTQSDNKTAKKNPYTIWFVILSFVAPVVLAYITFYFVDITSFTNKGQIFNPTIRIESLGLKDEAGVIIPKDTLTYKWRIYSFVGSRCDEACNKRLNEVRQLHKSLGKNTHRLIRVIVHLDKPEQKLTDLINTEYSKALNMYGDEQEITDAISNEARLRENEIYFMDPLGNIMMRFTQDQPIKDVRTDLGKLLKASQIG